MLPSPQLASCLVFDRLGFAPFKRTLRERQAKSMLPLCSDLVVPTRVRNQCERDFNVHSGL